MAITTMNNARSQMLRFPLVIPGVSVIMPGQSEIRMRYAGRLVRICDG